jgi:hypothetical protein
VWREKKRFHRSCRPPRSGSGPKHAFWERQPTPFLGSHLLWLGPSHFFIPLVIGPLNSLVWYVPSLRYTRDLGWRMHCGAEVTESSTNKQHHQPLNHPPRRHQQPRHPPCQFHIFYTPTETMLFFRFIISFNREI